MTLKFDHLIQFVHDPKKAMKIFNEHGFHAVEGGVHENRGTYNGLSYFDLSYIEFLGAYDKNLVKETKHPDYSLFSTILDNNFSEGFIRTAIRTEDILKTADRLEKKGLTVHGPVSLHRKTPNGTLIKWKLLYAGNQKSGPELPFFIQWNETDAERRRKLTKQKVISNHPIGNLQIDYVAYAVKNVNQIADQWANILGLQTEPFTYDDKLNASGKRLLLKEGNILLLEPKGNGIVSKIIEERGEKPFKVSFFGSSEKKSFHLYSGQFELK